MSMIRPMDGGGGGALLVLAIPQFWLVHLQFFGRQRLTDGYVVDSRNVPF